ncbi:MAG: hypothetical protein ACYDCX_10510 [Acidithiobacillus sp.]
MAQDRSRKEPILEASSSGMAQPLLLTKLLREGLPPPLWRDLDEPGTASHPLGAGAEDPYNLGRADPIIFPESSVPAMNAEVAPARDTATDADEAAAAGPIAEAVAAKTTPPARYQQSDAHWLNRSGPSVTLHPQNGEDGERAASTPMAEAVREELWETTPAAPSEALAPALSGENATPLPGTDWDFLKNFEGLLFQEVERRVATELEERLTQYLQTAWKEQVSLAVMRTLAMEGIKLREGIAADLRQALPDILQRVLREGLDQALPPDSDPSEP